MHRKSKRPASRLHILPLAVGLIYGTQALAAEEAAPAPSEKLETVVVTAQKRKEKLLDVPLAVTAISGVALEERGVEGAAQLSGVVPNLSLTHAPGAGLISSVGMRGIANGQPAIWADPSVGFYVDGVFVGKNMGSLFDVIDIAQLEVLRGPQGTLFGRNTEAGAVNFITKKPSGIFGGNVGIEVGNYNRRVLRANIETPLMGPFSASLSVRDEKQDGTIANPTAAAWGSKNRQAQRLALRLEASKDLTFDYAVDHSSIDEVPPAGSLVDSKGYGSLYPLTTQIGGTAYAFQNPSCLAQNPAGVCVFPSPGLAPGIRPYVNPDYPSSVAASNDNGAQYQRLNLLGHSLIAEYKLDADNTLKYTGAVRTMTYGDSLDYDGTPLPLFNGIRDTHYKTQSHELQLVGSHGALRYVGGLYYMKDSGDSSAKNGGTLYTFTPVMQAYERVLFDVGTSAKAVYGQLDYDLTPRLSVGVGGRYTKEDRSVGVLRYATDKNFDQGSRPTKLSGTAETSFSKFTPTLNTLYKLTPETNLFARYAQGFKSGGFPAEAPVTPTSSPLKPFSPEVSTAYELGIKTTLFDGKGQLSANLFHTDVKDYQISLLPAGSTSPTIVNAGKLRTQGLEVDAAFKLSRGVKLTLGYGYMETKFLQYSALSAANVPVDAASNTVPTGAPKQTLNLSLDARLLDLGNGTTLRGLVDYRYVAKRYIYPGQISATAANATVGNSAVESEMPALSTLDLRLILGGIQIGGPGFAEATLWVKNATNQHARVALMDVSGFYQVAYWNQPRTFGANLNYRW